MRTQREATVWPWGGGEMAHRIRTHSWQPTALGPIEVWPRVLRTTVDLILPNGLPLLILWGRELIQIYNDACRGMLGARHPACLGTSARHCWPESWNVKAPLFDRVLDGETVMLEETAWAAGRDTFGQESWFMTCYSPIREESGPISGILITLVDATARHAAERDRNNAERRLRSNDARQRFLRKLNDRIRSMGDAEAVVNASATLLADELQVKRVLYSNMSADSVHLEPVEGYEGRDSAPMSALRLESLGTSVSNPLRNGRTVVVDDVSTDKRFSTVDRGTYRSIDCAAAVFVPLIKGDRLVAIFMIQAQGARAWQSAEVELIEETAERTWAALERERAEATLRNSEELRRIAFEGGRMGTWRWDLERRVIWGDSEFLAVWGLPPSREPYPVSVFMVQMSSASAAALEATMTGSGQAGQEIDQQLQIFDGPNSGRWVRWRGRAEIARPWHINGVSFDVTRQRTSEDRLRISAERQKFMLKLSDELRELPDSAAIQQRMADMVGGFLRADHVFYAGWDPVAGTFAVQSEYLRGEARALLGQQRFEFDTKLMQQLLRGETLTTQDASRDDRFDPALREHFGHLSMRSFACAPLVKGGDLQACLWSANVNRRSWNPEELDLLSDIADRTWHAIQRAQAEEALRKLTERLDLLVSELQHRSRNLLAVIRSVAESTVLGSGSIEEFRGKFHGRLSALARVNGLLSRLEDAERVTFDELLLAELTALGASGDTDLRVKLQGPRGVRLRSGSIHTFALALHELATNSLKYGALSSSKGQLAVSWFVEPRSDGPRLHVDWTERGILICGPGRPARGTGYGRELIERALPYQMNAQTSYELGEEGVHCRIVLPISGELRTLRDQADT